MRKSASPHIATASSKLESCRFEEHHHLMMDKIKNQNKLHTVDTNLRTFTMKEKVEVEDDVTDYIRCRRMHSTQRS